jgi:hypothetical protein
MIWLPIVGSTLCCRQVHWSRESVRANGVTIRSHLFPPLLRVTAFIQESIFEGRCSDQLLSRESEPTSSASMDAEGYLTVQDYVPSAMDHVGTRNAISNKKAGTQSEAWPSVNPQYAERNTNLQFFLCWTLTHRFCFLDDGLSVSLLPSVESKLVEIETIEHGVVDPFTERRERDFERVVFTKD